MDKTLSTREYAELHGVSIRTVQRWRAEGQIFAAKIGRGFRIAEDEPPPNIIHDLPKPGLPSEMPPDDEPAKKQNPPRERDIYDPEEYDDLDSGDSDDCRTEDDFDRQDIRKSFATYDEALDYATPIKVSWEIYRHCETRRYFVVITY